MSVCMCLHGCIHTHTHRVIHLLSFSTLLKAKVRKPKTFFRAHLMLFLGFHVN